MNLPLNLFDGNANVRAFLCQPDKTIIGEILFYESNANFKFNTYSEISFTIDRYYNDLFDGETKVNPYYDLVESLRVIYLQGIGHFSIQDVDENISDNESKSVTCFSLEYTTGQKYLENFYVNTGEEGSIETIYHAQQYGAEYSIDNYYREVTLDDSFDAYERYYIKEYSSTNAYNYVDAQIVNADDFMAYDETLYVKKYPNVRFYWPTKPELSLLHHIFARIPEWKIGHVDKELWYQERTFSEDRVAVYDFLYNQAAETLKYVMVWDSIKGETSFYKTTEDGVTADNEVETQWNTDVFISKENLASAIDIKYSADDIKTKLKITGSDTLDVRDVNLGQNYILDLSYYIPKDTPSKWVGYHLQNKYNQYVDELAMYTEQYKELISAWSAAYNEYSDLMNHVPVEPSVLLIGDKFDKLYCTYGPSSPLTRVETQEMQELQEGGNVDLFNRPQIENEDGSISTVSTETFSNEDETIAMNFTPYIVDEDGQHIRTMDSSELQQYAEDIIAGVAEDYLKLKIGATFEGENAIENAVKAAERIHELQEKYYLSPTITVSELMKVLKTQLGLYRVGVDDNGKISAIDKTDDVLLTLGNDVNDSATIRVKCISVSSKYENYEYKIYRTLTTASSGLSETKEFSLDDWINGALTAEQLELVDKNGLPNFIVKSIGTLGAYLCISKDETVKENIEVYGIRLLEEKKETYTKIFITQTEGYMSKEGSRCVATDEAPEGASVGDKWLDTDSENAEVKEWNGTEWIKYSVNEEENQNSAEFENYTRFLDNYEKLQLVQEVLLEKQLIADYLLNGVAVNSRYLTDEDINAETLLSAAKHHFLNSTIVLTEYDAQFGFITFTVSSEPNNEYAVYVNNGTPYVSYAHSQGLCLAKMNKISKITDMNTYFTEEEIIGLSPYIREEEYSDDNFLLTGYESEEEQMNIKQELLKAGDEELKKLRQPKLSFSATMANILSIPEFAPLKYQFKLGNFIRVGIREGYVKRARLLEVQISFDNPSDFSATFGDLISTKSEIDKHADLLQQAVTAGKSVAANQGNWQRAVDKSTELDRKINDGLRDAALSVGAADGQAIVWDKYGIRGRKLVDGTTDQYEPEQFALINNKLVFTDDNWETSRAVVGEFEIELPNASGAMVKQNMYGLLADAIVGGYIQGTEIHGGKLEIGGSGGKFIVNEDGSVEIKTSTGSDVYAQTGAVTAIDAAYKYSIQIVHTGKAVFSSKTDTATMAVQIYRRGVDATDNFKNAGVVVNWEKNPSSEGWTPKINGDSYSIILDSEDVQNSVRISCYIEPTPAQIKTIESNYND